MSEARRLTMGTRRSQPKLRPVFYRLHAATMSRDTTADDLAAHLRAVEMFPERHRQSEGAVLAAALRRYQMLTGTAYVRGQS